MNLNELENNLIKIVTQNKNIKTILENMHRIENVKWYLGAGCIAQTVWNYYHDYNIESNIKDYDLVYFDNDLSEEKELLMQQKVNNFFADLKINIDVVNQGRVHIWYEKYFGYPIKPYSSITDAIATWPTTSTTVAISDSGNNDYKIYAPFGLKDLFSLTVRANKTQITQEIYNKKLCRWSAIWPKLTIISWDNS